MGRKEFYGYNRPDKGYDSDSYGLDKNYRDQLFGLFDEQYDALKKRLEEEIISYKDMYEGAKSKASALEGRVNVRDVMQALLPILTSIYNEVMDNGDLEDMRRTVQKQMSRLTRQLGKAGVELKYHERGDKFRDGDTISTISVPTWDRSAHGTVKSCYTMGCVIRGEENNPLIEEAEIYEYDRSMRPPVEEKPETVEAVTVENPYEQENSAPVTDENPYEQENPAPVTVQNPYEPQTVAPVTVETPMTAVSESGQLSFEIEAASYGRRPVSVCPVKDLKKRLSSRYALVYDGTSAAFCDENNCFEVYFSGFGELCDTVSRIGGELIVYDCKKMISDFKLESRTVKVYDDVMLMAYVADPARSGYELFDLAEIYLKTSIEETLSDKAFAVYGLHERLTERLERENMLELYRTVELPLAEVLADMESAGFMLDIEALQEFLQRLCKTEAEYTERIYALAGHEFNINSPKQLGTVLFEELGLTAGKKTKSGYSTSAEILEKLRSEHEIVGEILDYRAVAKLRSTYAEALLKLADKNGRVHTVFSQTTAVTGRLASSEPNLQNIPVRTELGREMRRFFVASSPDRVLIDADYSQIELRLLAHIARDETMINAFISGEDIHTVTASQVFGVPISEVTGEMRKRAKAVNFGIVYGIGEFSLAQDIGVSRKEAGEYINNYFAKYGGIATYLSAAVEAAKTLGFVETIFGRRRYIPELTSGKAMLRAFGERVAMNSPIQGSSADIIKLAMINVHKALKAERIDARLILQIHDELIVEADRDQAEEAAEILKREMENVVKLSVPLTVELQTGNSWFDCK